MSWQWCLFWTFAGVVVGGGLLAAILYFEFPFDFESIPGFLVSLVGGLAILAGCFSWVAYSPHPGAPCLHSHPETSYVYISTSKYTGVMEPMTDNVCDLWGPK